VPARRLKIAMLSVHSCPVGELGTKDTGGMSVYVRELARALGNRGHTVDIFTRLHDPKDSQIMELGDNARLIHIKAGYNGDMHKMAIYPHLADFLTALENFRKHDARKYDLVHSHYWLSGWVGGKVQDLWAIPHIAMFHTLGAVKNAIGVGEKEPELRVATETEIIKSCHRIIAATKREKEELMRYYNAVPETIGVVPCGVNLELFKPVDKKTAREQLGLNHERKIILYVGRIDPLKGVDRLITAGAYLKNKYGLKLIIIGGDDQLKPEWQRLKKLSHKLRFQDSVTFVGRIKQEELPLFYSAADVLVIASHHESFGLVALESLACGTPVVATKVGGIEGILRQGETGYVVTDDVPRSLATKITQILSRPHPGLNPPDSIRASITGFSWSNIADAMIEEYAFMLKHGIAQAA